MTSNPGSAGHGTRSDSSPPPGRARADLILAAAGDNARSWDDLPIDERTKAMYRREYGAFAAWCGDVGLSCTPASARTVSRYLEHLVRTRGRAMATAERVRAAISVAHEMAYSAAHAVGTETPPNPARDILVAATITRLRKEILGRGEPVQQPKREIRYDELADMIRSEPNTLSGKRNRAIMAVTWFGMFRRSEVVSLDLRSLRYRRGQHAGFQIALLQSKANKTGEPETIALSQRDDLPICPARELKAWLDELKTARLTHGPVFRRIYPAKKSEKGGRIGEHALSATMVSQIVKAAADRVGIAPPDELGAHSLRSGSATELSAHNVSTDRLMTKGRWKSFNAARRYIRSGDALVNDPMRNILRNDVDDK